MSSAERSIIDLEQEHNAGNYFRLFVCLFLSFFWLPLTFVVTNFRNVPSDYSTNLLLAYRGKEMWKLELPWGR